MVANRSAPPGAVVPSLCYPDVQAAIAWLCDVFGFREHLRWGPTATPTAQLQLGGGAIFVRGPRAGSADATALRPPLPDGGSHTIMVAVDDVDRHHDHSAAHGAQITLELQTHPFGERQYSAIDLAGHEWTFTQSVGDVDPVDWGATVA
jgi:uncharacterized glyoxalase superfamily protein PhnB